MFLEQAHGVLFLLSGALCLLYYIINNIGLHVHYGTGMMRPILWSSAFALLLSLPLMPFVTSWIVISTASITFFALSYAIWQTIYLSTQHDVSVRNLIVPVAIVNLIAWAVVAFVNYKFISLLTCWVSSLYV